MSLLLRLNVARSGATRYVLARSMSSAAPVDISLVKDLRARTGSPVKDCKAALEESGGDMEKAVEWLRKKGVATAAKKVGRTAAEGLVGCFPHESSITLVEINSETDFVARNERFLSLLSAVGDVAARTLAPGGDPVANVDRLLKAALPSGGTVESGVAEAIGAIQENIVLRRARKVDEPNGVVASYVHTAVRDNMGRKAAVVALRTNATDAAARASLAEVARKVAMHVVVAQPRYLNKEAVPEAALEAERALQAEQARASGKPEKVIAKMVEGRMGKFYQEICLAEQIHMIEGENVRVSKHVEDAAAQLGVTAQLSDYALFNVGEGAQ